MKGHLENYARKIQYDFNQATRGDTSTIEGVMRRDQALFDLAQDLGIGPRFSVPIGPASPSLSLAGGGTLASETVTVSSAAISGTAAVANMAHAEIQPSEGDKVGQQASNEKERVYDKPPPGESTKHGDKARSSSRGEISPAPQDGQAALDNSTVVKEKPNGETRVSVDQINKEVVVFDRQQQTATQDIFHGHVPKVLKPDVRNVVRKEFPQVRVKKDGTWEVRDLK